MSGAEIQAEAMEAFRAQALTEDLLRSLMRAHPDVDAFLGWLERERVRVNAAPAPARETVILPE
ncbi:MAG: hypothetical protein AAFU79_25225 [Myxococcota bacterium]